MENSITLAHIVNPFQAPKDSDLRWAQPITFESMRRAKTQAKDSCEIDLLSAQFKEDIHAVPKDFKPTENLARSVLDYSNFSQPIRLPLIADILNRMSQESRAEYLIYTNVDIGLYPNFYVRVCELIREGYDALIINRQRLPDKYRSEKDLDSILALKGLSHPGFDCFVMKRELVEQFELKNICIGVPFIGITMAQNIFALSNKYALLENEKLTFHLGLEIFKKRAPRDYLIYNRNEYWKVLRTPLREKMKASKLPFSNSSILKRIIKYGLNPSIPIRLVLTLEWEALWKK